MKKYNYLLSFLLLFLFVINVNCQNECESLSSDFVTYTELQQCLSAQNYSSTIKEQTLQTLNAIIDSYVFVDISRNSPNPTNIPMNVDIDDILEEIEQSTYLSDAEMQQAFASAFINFQDAHTRYTKPVIPYCHSSFSLPIKIQSTISNLKQVFLVNYVEELLTVYQGLYGVDLTHPNIQGYNILLINGDDPLTAIGSFANSSVGYSKDYSSRFNLAVDGYGPDFPAMYTCRNQSLQGIPEASMNFTLQNPMDSSVIELSINWIGTYYRNISSPLYSQLKEKRTIGTHEINFLKEYQKIIKSEKIKNQEKKEEITEEKFKKLEKKEIEAVEEAAEVTYTILSDTITGVLQITTFEPKNHSIFINTIQNGLLFFKENLVQQLIIDLSQNGGGDICLGYSLFRSLFPNENPIVGSYDMKSSQLFELFANAGASLLHQNISNHQECGVNPELVGYFTPCAWYDWYSGDLYSDISWFIPGIPYTRGGVLDDYSVRVTQGCQDAYSLWLPPTGTQFSADKIILLSDGLCGSTCAVFARHIQLNHLAKTIVTGGVLGSQRPSFTSFPGGEVVDLDFVFKLAERYNLSSSSSNSSSSLIPPSFPTSASFRFAIREIYGWEEMTLSSYPQEFVYLPADFQLFYGENYLEHAAIWQQVIPYFSICADWETLPCPVDNGTGYYPCVDGSFSKEECLLAGCNAGYENINNGCAECQLGFYKSEKGLGSCAPCYSIPPNCKYTSLANLSPVCTYTCSACATETPAPPATIVSESGVDMPIWLIIVITVGSLLIGLALGGFLGNLVTRTYFQRKIHRYSALEPENYNTLIIDNQNSN